MKAASLYDLTDLLGAKQRPCISVYEQTHKGYPGNQQDPIRFRELVDQAETALLRDYSEQEVRPLLEPLKSLAQDHEFWKNGWEGLAAFVSPGVFRVYGLNRSVPERAIVADSFHLKPLIRLAQSADRYQVLCLSRHSASLYEGNRDGLEAIDLAPGIPRTNDSALLAGAADDRLERVPSHRRHANEVPSHVQRIYGTASNALESDAERFFRAIDRGVIEHHRGPSQQKLVIVALAENQELFRRISHNPALIPEGVVAEAQSLSVDQIREAAWSVVLPHYQSRRAELVAAFEEARGRGHGTADLAEATRAAMEGRVRTLLIDASKSVPGSFDHGTGVFQFMSQDDPTAEDLLDYLAQIVLEGRGEVLVLPPDQMPVPSGLAATYRY